jgi:hypothetical protein
MLTDEERKKIYEEEKVRIEAQEELRRKTQHQRKGGLPWWVPMLIIFAVLFAFVKMCGKQATDLATPSSTPVSYEPRLELVSWNWGQTSESFVEAKGLVKNISSERLENVQAVVTFFNKDKDFITSSDALIEYNPIMPGQTSPFSVLETYNPAMRSATIEFKHLMGGTIPTRHNEK